MLQLVEGHKENSLELSPFQEKNMDTSESYR